MKGVLSGLLGVVCAVAIVACGGDDDAPIVPVQTTTTPVEGLDKDEFINQGDAICAEADAAISSVSAETDSDAAVQVSEQRDIVEGMLEQLEGLGAPPEDEETLDDFFTALEEWIDALDKQELAAERDDTASVESLSTEVDAAESEARAAAEDYGFEDCAEGAETTITGTDTGADTGAPAPAPAPAPTAPAPAPAEPAPAPAPAPAPPSGGTGGGTGGTEPGGSGGVSP